MQKTRSEDLSLYEDAVSCLATAAAECEKTCNVDITLLLCHSEQAEELVNKLTLRESNPLRLEALKHLRGMLNYHQVTFRSKIRQLQAEHSTMAEVRAADAEPKVGIASPGLGELDVGAGGENTASTVTQKRQERGYDQEDNLSADKRKRYMAIQATKVTQASLNFSDVAGLEEAKQALREAVIMPIEYPHLFTGSRKPWQRILLYGPPGTGKSRLAQAVAAEIKSYFYCISSSDLLSSWVGETEKLIKELFQNATSREGTSVVFIDEIDSVCRRRSSGEQDHSRRIKTELLHQMEGAMTGGGMHGSRVFLLAATNCPWELDPGFLRRFQKRIYIPLPDKAARRQLMELHMRGTTVPLSESDWEQLTTLTTGYSGSDLANMVLGALFEPIRELQKAKTWHHTREGRLTPCEPSDPGAFMSSMTSLPSDQVTPRDVQLRDFILSLTQHQRTVTDEDLISFDEFTKHFGQNG